MYSADDCVEKEATANEFLCEVMKTQISYTSGMDVMEKRWREGLN